ncbi:MAG: hypothetical protein FD155_3432 [Bacteroidetes bacterium]|nr:MAG: hypothetical protein FD155_3432 [Bacteroidota bacterium]
MRHTYFFTALLFLALTFSGTQLLIAQSVYKGTAEAFSRMSLQQMKAEDSSYRSLYNGGFKKPNPVIYNPQIMVNPSDVTDTEILTVPQSYLMQSSSPAPDTSFDALYDSGNSIPPDVNGAPGPDHLMVTLNTEIRIQDRQGVPLETLSLGLFWNSLPGGNTFDPKILYDFEEDRWIFVTCAGSDPGDSRIYMGVSANSDPTGEWFLYSYIADPQNDVWFDYPSMGFNGKWIVVSGNMFGGDFYRTVYVFDKHAMYNGEETPQFTRFSTVQGFTLVPAITYDADQENVYLVSSANGNQGGMGYITLFKVQGELANPQFSLVGQIGTNQPWEGGVSGSGDFLPQLGSDQLINAVDHRMENVIFRNNKIWAVHHVFLPANNPQRTSVQWWNITPEGSLIQRGRVDDPSGLMSYAFATVAVNHFEDMIIGHGIFSTNQYAGAGYSFRANADPINQTRLPFQYKEGLAPYYKTFGGGRNRWGDYSATMLDPVNGVDFWVLQEYAELPSGGDRWGTWWAYVTIPFAPEASFSSNETLIPLGESVNFTDQSVGVPQSWSWSFEGGNPSTSDLQHPSGITYTSEGSFDVSLTVTNEFGTNTVLLEDYITVSATLLPAIAFTADKSLVCTSEIVTFTDATQYMPISWEWIFTPSTVTFVNGTDAFSQNPEVIFDEAGSYALTLHATNLNGSSQTTTFDVVKAGGMEVPLVERFNVNGFDENHWKIQNPDASKTWDLVSVAGLTETDKAARLDFLTYYAIGARDQLVTPPLDLRNFNSMVLGFKHAHARRITQISDSLIVKISDDCGQSWTRLFADAEDGTGNFATHPMSEGFVPMVREDWCGAGYGADCIQLDISNWAGKSDVLVLFESYSGYGNPMYVTDIEISTTVNLEEESATETLKVVPNPVHTSLILQQSGSTTFEEVSVYNAEGKLMLQLKNVTSGTKLEVSNLSAGIYTIRATAKSKIFKTSFIKE